MIFNITNEIKKSLNNLNLSPKDKKRYLGIFISEIFPDFKSGKIKYPYDIIRVFNRLPYEVAYTISSAVETAKEIDSLVSIIDTKLKYIIKFSEEVELTTSERSKIGSFCQWFDDTGEMLYNDRNLLSLCKMVAEMPPSKFRSKCLPLSFGCVEHTQKIERLLYDGVQSHY